MDRRQLPPSGIVLSSSPPATSDDVVIIAFSGHGTETHELVAHDTDPYDLAGTTIPLTTLGEWCSRIPSRRLLIVLDCCFSGGMGAKALEVEGVPRDFQSVDGKLNQISGAGPRDPDCIGSDAEGVGEPAAGAWLSDLASARSAAGAGRNS